MFQDDRKCAANKWFRLKGELLGSGIGMDIKWIYMISNSTPIPFYFVQRCNLTKCSHEHSE